MGQGAGQIAKGIPIIGPMIAGIDANDAANKAQQEQNDVLTHANQFAQELADTNYVNPIIQAGESGIRTFESSAGGVPNIGELVMSLFGDNVKNAMQVAANERGSNLRGAIGGLQASGNQYAGVNDQASKAAAAAAGQEQQQIESFGGFPSFGGGTPTFEAPAATGVSTGIGTAGKSSDPFASWSASPNIDPAVLRALGY